VMQHFSGSFSIISVFTVGSRYHLAVGGLIVVPTLNYSLKEARVHVHAINNNTC
jgi:hypothetical protein